ncbi:hypothetical protein KSP40_PGU015104 [Platanthera guangdongensis]|uniref:Uncharacterized protein n=1 Tax=Platanthera guangdongensis TaxID=2320717 RepID=A0ABR2N254_9ASPA
MASGLRPPPLAPAQAPSKIPAEKILIRSKKRWMRRQYEHIGARHEVEHRSDPLSQEITPAARSTRADAPPLSPEFRDVSSSKQQTGSASRVVMRARLRVDARLGKTGGRFLLVLTGENSSFPNTQFGCSPKAPTFPAWQRASNRCFSASQFPHRQQFAVRKIPPDSCRNKQSSSSLIADPGLRQNIPSARKHTGKKNLHMRVRTRGFKLGKGVASRVLGARRRRNIAPSAIKIYALINALEKHEYNNGDGLPGTGSIKLIEPLGTTRGAAADVTTRGLTVAPTVVTNVDAATNTPTAVVAIVVVAVVTTSEVSGSPLPPNLGGLFAVQPSAGVWRVGLPAVQIGRHACRPALAGSPPKVKAAPNRTALRPPDSGDLSTCPSRAAYGPPT